MIPSATTPLGEPELHAGDGPAISFIMPCYNEEEILGETLPSLIAEFAREGFRIEVIAVDNGSRDRTGAILQALAAEDPRIVPIRVEQNIGYGNGVLQGIPHCTAPWVGLIPADLQVDARDVVKLFRLAISGRGPKLYKIRRRFRLETVQRRIVSVTYNIVTTLLFGGLGTLDINGLPKILPREALRRMSLKSRDWFLEAEIVIKARELGLPIFELNAFSQMRPGGASNVRAVTCLEFIGNLLKYRFLKRSELRVPPLDVSGAAAAAAEPSARA